MRRIGWNDQDEPNVNRQVWVQMGTITTGKWKRRRRRRRKGRRRNRMRGNKGEEERQRLSERERGTEEIEENEHQMREGGGEGGYREPREHLEDISKIKTAWISGRKHHETSPH